MGTGQGGLPSTAAQQNGLLPLLVSAVPALAERSFVSHGDVLGKGGSGPLVLPRAAAQALVPTATTICRNNSFTGAEMPPALPPSIATTRLLMQQLERETRSMEAEIERNLLTSLLISSGRLQPTISSKQPRAHNPALLLHLASSRHRHRADTRSGKPPAQQLPQVQSLSTGSSMSERQQALLLAAFSQAAASLPPSAKSGTTSTTKKTPAVKFSLPIVQGRGKGGGFPMPRLPATAAAARKGGNKDDAKTAAVPVIRPTLGSYKKLWKSLRSSGSSVSKKKRFETQEEKERRRRLKNLARKEAFLNRIRDGKVPVVRG